MLTMIYSITNITISLSLGLSNNMYHKQLKNLQPYLVMQIQLTINKDVSMSYLDISHYELCLALERDISIEIKPGLTTYLQILIFQRLDSFQVYKSCDRVSAQKITQS